MELLAPAGSFEALKAAVSAGADAVYFGGTAFNARVFGKNFTDEEVVQAASYCRRFGVKAYLTLNTLVSDQEKDGLDAFLQMINDSCIDGLIVQDLGLARMLRRILPDLPIHASTQMTICNLDGVKTAAEMGFSRVVLSRELPASEIEYITKNSPVEIEAFIHGALCMCYSGQCYLSSVIGERSGNRGKCAQPCRKAYGNGYELSLKDLCMAEDFVSFMQTGVHSLKIEGRMKSPAYVAGVVSVYRKLIDQNRNATPEEMQFLAELFSREGFTNGYYKDKTGRQMFGIRTEQDKAQSREAEVEIPEKKIKINASFTAGKDEPMKLMFYNETHCAEAVGDIPLIAEKNETSVSDCEKQLSKLGNTDFVMDTLQCDIEKGLFIPVGALNRLRRACVEAFEAELTKKEPRRFLASLPAVLEVAQTGRKIAVCNTKEQAEAIAGYVDEIRLPLHLIDRNYGEKTAVLLPFVIWDREWKRVEEKLELVKAFGITKAVCRNIGQLARAKEKGFLVATDTGLNVFNSESILMLKELGVSEVTLSMEANAGQIRDMKKALPASTVVYGRYPVMVMQNCIMKNKNACIDFKGYGLLKDETDRAFPVFCEMPHRNVIYNACPLYIGDKEKLLPDTDHVFLFTTESGAEAKRILTMYENGETAEFAFTRGFYNKKV
ncbi:MAG: U32 family peptidase [Clostridia bacterium]|nr:U32 family peptidase [Clostridia bacterium]